MFIEDFEQSTEPNLPYFLAAPIVLDTFNFFESIKGQKWGEDDFSAHQFLSKYAQVGDEYF